MTGTKNHRGWGWIRKRASGRYQASYVGPDLQRHDAPGTFELKMDAEHWLAREHREIEAALAKLTNENRSVDGLKSVWLSPSERVAAALAASQVRRETLADYGKLWIAQRDLKPKTRSEYTTYFENFISPELGSIAIEDLTSAMVRSWYAKTLVNRPTYRARTYGLLHGICASAVKDDLMAKNLCQIDGATNTKNKARAVILEIDELAAVADAIRPERFRALVLISAWCGLRYGEVSELRRKDIARDPRNPDDDCAVISIDRAVVHLTAKQAANGPRCIVDTPKSGQQRKVVVPPHIRPAIAQHLEQFVSDDPESKLFGSVRGGCHLSDKVIRDALAPALKSIGRERMQIHDMRHFAGTMRARVANLPETMDRLGHSTSS